MRTTKTCSIKVLRPHIIDGALQMPVGGRTPSSVPRAASHPFLATAKMQKKKWVLVFRRSLLFRPNFPKTQGAIGDHTIQCKIYFFSIVEVFVFASFLPIFRPFLR